MNQFIMGIHQFLHILKGEEDTLLLPPGRRARGRGRHFITPGRRVRGGGALKLLTGKGRKRRKQIKKD